MNDKPIQPVFVDASKTDLWDETKAETLRRCGYEIIFIPDVKNALHGLPITPFILPGDIVTSCLLKAVTYSDAASKKFGELMLKELQKVNSP